MTKFFGRLFFVLLIFISIFVSSRNVFAETCSNVGYTVLTINGVFTDEIGARKNAYALQRKLDSDTFNSESITIDYLHNPSHLGGIGDVAKVVYQKVFDNETVKDYDLVEMLKDASEKVKTQKILLVAHSQGNFYANSFYDIVAGKEGGVPVESVGVYAVATPASRVAGGGEWLTSDTDKIIADLVGSMPFKKIMPPNTSIALAEGDDANGHNFSGVYLKHRGSKIIYDIKNSLNKLKTNNSKNAQKSCLEPPKITLAHKITGAVFAAADPLANTGKDAIVVASSGAYQAGKALAKGVYSLTSFIAGAVTSALSVDNKNTNNEAAVLNAINSDNISSLPAEEAGEASSSSSENYFTEENVETADNSQPATSAVDKIKLAEESLKNLQRQISTLQNQTNNSSSSNLPGLPSGDQAGLTLGDEAIQPKFVAAISPGFGGGGMGVAESSSSSSLPADEAGSSSSNSSSSSSSSSSDTAPPTISSFSISECQQSLSSDGCLVATTTLNIAWNSSSPDLDYFTINNNGAVSATTSTSTVAIAPDNAIFSFAVSAKDLAGNFSATSTQTAEVSIMPIVINEVAWAGNGAAYSADEWIELYNRTNKTVNFTDWTLYSKTNLTPYVNLSGQIISKDYYLLERTNDDTISNIAADKIYTGDLLNAGENIVLVYKPVGQATTTIDEIPYDFNWYAGSSFNYSTMEKYDADIAGTDSTNWGTNNTIIKNGRNAGGGNINGTPKARNSANYLIAKGASPISSSVILTKSNSPYLVNHYIQVFNASSTLTVEPGVVIKFYNDAGLSFNGGARISAVGSSAEPIIFTSFYDDAYAGDTNGDATSTAPSAGNWYGVRIDSPGAESTISHAVFRYGGKYYSGAGWTDSKANLYITNSSANIANSVFEYANVYGVKLSEASAAFSGDTFRYNNNSEGDSTGLYSIGGTLTLNSNTFSNNKKGLYIQSANSANINSNTFTSNTGEAVYSYGQLGSYASNSGSGNSVNGIVISGDLTTTNSTTTLGVNSLPYVIKTYDATIAAGSALVIPSGIVLKANKKLNVNGNLSITGSNAGDVILTSLYDDTAAGDATNDGNSNSPQAGQGGWINISSAGSFTGSGFTARYGGSHAYGGNNSAWLYFDGSGGSVSNALFDNNYPYGIYAANSSGLNISNTSFANHTYSGDWGTKAALSALASSVVLSAVSFTGNILGVLSNASAFVVSAVTFTSNTATTSPSGLW